MDEQVVTHYADGVPLVFWEKKEDQRTYHVLTVKNDYKWYALYLVSPEGVVTRVDFSELEQYATATESPWWDHVPNAVVVERLAAVKGWVLDAVSRELLVGRWCTDVVWHVIAPMLSQVIASPKVMNQISTCN